MDLMVKMIPIRSSLRLITIHLRLGLMAHSHSLAT
nr:hypothetical protein I308_06196 [Cryptococcus tetragattii IND107]